MARDAISLALGENAAFKKLEQGLKWAIEGATEISTLRSDPRWAAISLTLEKVLDNSGKLANNAAKGAVKGILLG